MIIKFIFVSVLLSISAFSKENAKRLVAQDTQNCVPLGVPLKIAIDRDYTDKDYNLMKNSIYAQLGFKFQSKEIEDEMKSRGCLKTDVAFDAKKMNPIDKKNASLLQSLEDNAYPSDVEGSFRKAWPGTASQPSKRKKMLADQYCFLNDISGKFIGLINFSKLKAKDGFLLEGMMNIEKPTWTDGIDSNIMSSVGSDLAKKSIDTTGIRFLEFHEEGIWFINSTKSSSLGTVQITMKTSSVNLKNVAIQVEPDGLGSTGVLVCNVVQ